MPSRCRSDTRRTPSRARRSCVTLPTPGMMPTGLSDQERRRLRAPDDRKAAGLVEVGRDLGQELVVGQPDRDAEPELRLHPAREARTASGPGWRGAGAAVPVRSRKASSIETGSTSGVSSSISWRTSRPDGGIFLHVGLDHHRVGAGVQRLEHGHGRAHAIGAGDVAGGGDHAALAAADDHRLVGERGIVALLDGGEEGVAIDMGDGERFAFRVVQQARGAARAAAPARARRSLRQAVPADRGHRPRRRAGSGIGSLQPSRLRAVSSHDSRATFMFFPSRSAVAETHRIGAGQRVPGREIRAGGTPALVAKVRSSDSSEARWSSTATKNPGDAAASRTVSGVRPGQVEEAAEALGVRGEEAEGFDGQFLGSAASAILPDHLQPRVRFVFHQRVAVISSAARADEPPGARADEAPGGRASLQEPRDTGRGMSMAKTVLIVEDNELNMKLFNDLLEAHGYATLKTSSGMEAHRACAPAQPRPDPDGHPAAGGLRRGRHGVDEERSDDCAPSPSSPSPPSP